MRYILSTALILYGLAAQAQGKADSSRSGLKGKNMDEVVITGQYAPNKRENAVQKIEVIDRKKIDAMAAQNLRDVLTNQQGIRLSQDAIFGSGLSLQGSQSYGQSVKILVDGVAMIGKQNGSIDLSQINLNNIERIEIIEGPMSVAYGTDAIAGTINLITKKTQRNTWEGGINTYYESNGTYNIYGNAGYSKKRHTVLLNGGRNFFDGWNPGDKFSFFDFKAAPADTNRTMQWKPREQYMGGLQYTYTTNKTSINYKSNYFYETITNRGMPMLPYYEMAFDDYYHTRRIDNAVYLKSELPKNKHLNIQVAYNTYKRIKNQYTNDLTTLQDELTPGQQDTSKYHELSSRGTFGNAGAAHKINYELGYDINMQDANSTQLLGQKQHMGTYAAFASAEYRPVTQLVIRPGLRYGYNTRFKAPLIPSLNLMYKPGTHWTFRASYARGFREPNLKELYFEFVDINHNIHGNTNLHAERSNNYSASAVYAGKKNDVSYSISLSGFRNDIDSLITLAIVPGTTANEYTYVNIGKYKTQGLQLNAEVQVSHFTISAGGTYIGTYNDESEQNNVPKMSYSPEVRGSVMYNPGKYGLSAAVFYKYTGRFTTYIADNNNNPVQAFTDGYQMADATITKTLFDKHFNISLGCKNLFDVKNINSMVAGGAHSSGSGVSSMAMGRYYFAKLEYKFF